MAQDDKGLLGLADALYPKQEKTSNPAVSGLTALAHALANQRPNAKQLYFRNKTIDLDGYTFTECRFDNCVLNAATPNFDLINCIIDPTTTIKYSNYSNKIIRLFNSRYDWAEKYFGSQFVPVNNPDGTITITDKPIP